MPAVFSPRSAEPVMRDNRGNTYSASSFGADLTTFGPTFKAHALMRSERRRELEFRARYYRCSQHDTKVNDFDGRLVPPGRPVTQPLISGAMPTFYVPLSQRRPFSPYRLARVIVKRFTSLVFGRGRFPSIRVVGDPDSQDFAEALVKAMRLPAVMVRVRNLGGACGTAGLSWVIYDGVPRARAHSGEHLHVHSWADREELVPEHVTELYQFARDEFDPAKKEVVHQRYWFRRDWTPNADVFFIPQKVETAEPEWVIDGDNTVMHNDGFCHFVWIANLPSDDPSGYDGEPDYLGIEDNFGSLDILNSVVAKGAALNLDPTLKLKMDPELVRRGGVKKGSDNALVVGEAGDASYMELSGTSITAGNAIVERERAQALEVAQCIVPDPNTIAAAGTSSLALKLVFGPMLDQADVMREQYGQAIERLLEQVIASVQKRLGQGEVEIVVDPETGEEREAEVEYVLALAPRVVTEDVVDAEGSPTGETQIQLVERHPGEGGDVEIEWPEYFRMTADDKQKAVATLSAAAGGKPVISHRSAVEQASEIYELDPIEEWKLVAEQMKTDQQLATQSEAMMFPPIGGTPGEDGLPAAGGEELDEEVSEANVVS